MYERTGGNEIRKNVNKHYIKAGTRLEYLNIDNNWNSLKKYTILD